MTIKIIYRLEKVDKLKNKLRFTDIVPMHGTGIIRKVIWGLHTNIRQVKDSITNSVHKSVHGE